MIYQALFSLKDKSKNLKCCLLQFLFGTFRVKYDGSHGSIGEIVYSGPLRIHLLDIWQMDNLLND